MNHLTESPVTSITVTMFTGTESDSLPCESTFMVVVNHQNESDSKYYPKTESQQADGCSLTQIKGIVKRYYAYNNLVLTWESPESDSQYTMDSTNIIESINGILQYKKLVFTESGCSVESVTPITRFDSLPYTVKQGLQLYYQLLGLLPITQGGYGGVLPVQVGTQQGNPCYTQLDSVVDLNRCYLLRDSVGNVTHTWIPVNGCIPVVTKFTGM